MRRGQFKSLIPLLSGVTLVGILARPVSPVIPGVNFLMILSPPGQVKLKRPHWQKYQPIIIGTPLRNEDRLLLPKGAQAEVLCQNLTEWKVPDGRESIVSEGCPPVSNPKLRESEEDTADSRAINDPKIPYILSPRNTKLLPTQSLTLRWNQVEGAKNYRVELVGPGVNLNQETRENQLVYTAKPPLKRGVRYWFNVVTDKNKTSTFEGTPGFTILSEKEVKETLGAVEEIKQKQLSREAQVLAIAHLYQSKELYNEAIKPLETAIQDGIKSTAIYQLLGEIHQKIGLNRLARLHYLKALKLTKPEADLEGLANIQGGLAITNAIIRYKDDALKYLEYAKASYKKLERKKEQEKTVRKLEAEVSRILGI